MKTATGSAHRHKTKSVLWYDLTDVDSGSPHTHDVDLSSYDMKIADLTARLVALERPASPFPPDTSLRYAATPSVPLPGYLTPIIDPTFGTKVTRISNVAGQAPYYSKAQCWNADGSLLLLGRTWPGVLLDGRTYAVIDPSFHHPSESHWSPTNPRILYGFSGNKMTWMDPLVDQVFHDLHVFAGYTNILPSAQGNFSDDGRYIALLGTATGSEAILIYDVIADSVFAMKGGFTTRPHAITMSGSGLYVIVGWSGDGTGLEQGTWLYNRSLGAPIRQLFASTGHADCGWDSAGHEVWVGGRGSTDPTETIYAQRLDTVQNTPVLPPGSAFWYGHVSCRNTARPGWAYLSNYDTTKTVGRVGSDQVIAVKLDGSMAVEVYGHAHHGADVAPKDPEATVSRDGRRVLFASEWGASDVFAYMAEA